MKNNVPFDVAMSIPDEESLAYAVILGTFEGGKFSWDRMRWEDQK